MRLLKRRSSRFCSILLAVVLALSLAPAQVVFASGEGSEEGSEEATEVVLPVEKHQEEDQTQLALIEKPINGDEETPNAESKEQATVSDASAETPAEPPAGTPAETPAEPPAGTPAETPAEPPAGTPAKTPAKTPAEMLAESPVTIPDSGQVDAGADAEEDAPASPSDDESTEETPDLDNGTNKKYCSECREELAVSKTDHNYHSYFCQNRECSLFPEYKYKEKHTFSSTHLDVHPEDACYCKVCKQYCHWYGTYYEDGVHVSPTCTEPGCDYDDACSYCERCELYLASDDVVAGTYMPPLGHDWETEWSSSESLPIHYHACTRCSERSDEAAHEYSWTSVDDSIHKGICSVCGAETTESHSGGEATCTSKPICDVCDNEYGEPLGHDWGSWEPDPADDTKHRHICQRNGCGAAESKAHSGGEATDLNGPICEVCGQEYGEPLGSAIVGYTVKFDSNVPANASTACEENMADQSFASDEKKALSANGYFLPGYEFKGWTTQADGSGDAYADKSEVEGLAGDGETVTLYAQWTAKSYTITYQSDDTGSRTHTQIAYFDQPDELDKYSDAAFGWDSSGKVLHGWVGDRLGSSYEDGDDFCNLCGTPNADGSLANVTLTAEWEENGQVAAEQLTVRWLDGDGDVLLSKTYVEGDELPAYDGKKPTKAATAQYAYEFSGWDDGTAEGFVTTYKSLFKETLRQYRVTFVDYDGKSVLKEAVSYDYGTPVDDIALPSEPKRKVDAQHSYIFAGWTPEVVAVTGDATYTATYDAVPVVATLSFDLAGGTLDGKTGTITVEANVGDAIKLPDAPTREGYTFKCWRGSEYAAGADYEVEGNHAFTAEWVMDSSSTGKTDGGADNKTGGGADNKTGGSTAVPGTGDDAGMTLAALVLAALGSLLVLAFCTHRHNPRQ